MDAGSIPAVSTRLRYKLFFNKKNRLEQRLKKFNQSDIILIYDSKNDMDISHCQISFKEVVKIDMLDPYNKTQKLLNEILGTHSVSNVFLADGLYKNFSKITQYLKKKSQLFFIVTNPRTLVQSLILPGFRSIADYRNADFIIAMSHDQSEFVSMTLDVKAGILPNDNSKIIDMLQMDIKKQGEPLTVLSYVKQFNTIADELIINIKHYLIYLSKWELFKLLLKRSTLYRTLIQKDLF